MKKSAYDIVVCSVAFEAQRGYKRQTSTRKSRFLLLDSLLYRISGHKSTWEPRKACMAAFDSGKNLDAGHEMESVLKINPGINNFGIYEIIRRDG